MRLDRSPKSFSPRHLAGVAAGLLLPLCAFCAGTVTSSDYAYRFALDTQGSNQAWRVELSPAVYAVSRPDAELRDLVVVNAQGREVPFAPLPPAPPSAHPYTLNARLLPLPAVAGVADGSVRVQRNASGDIVIEPTATTAASAKPTQWLLDARREVSLDSIEIDPSAFTRDLRFRVEVDASNDLQAWDHRGDDTDIVHLKHDEDAVEQRKISVGGDPARYYRIRLTDGDAPWDGTQTPAVSLSGSYVDAQADRFAALQWQTLHAAAGQPAAGGGTDYDYELPAALPVEAAQVTLSNANTAARFSLLDGAAGGANASPLATITAVQVAGKTASSAPTSRFDPVRLQHLRLHTDTPLAQPPSLALGWHPDVFVFLAEGAAPYSLLAGSYAARRGDYPVDAALEKVRPSDAAADWQPPLAALGERSDVGGAEALLPPKVPFDWTRPLLWLVLVGGALLVAGMALSLLRQSKRDNGAS